jgi:hypothetical protein
MPTVCGRSQKWNLSLLISFLSNLVPTIFLFLILTDARVLVSIQYLSEMMKSKEKGRHKETADRQAWRENESKRGMRIIWHPLRA